MTKTTKFVFEKSTKNTYKYNEVPPEGSAPAIGMLYVQKWAYPIPPLTLLVSVETPDPQAIKP